MGKFSMYVSGLSTFGCINCIADGNVLGAILYGLLAITNLVSGINE